MQVSGLIHSGRDNITLLMSYINDTCTSLSSLFLACSTVRKFGNPSKHLTIRFAKRRTYVCRWPPAGRNRRILADCDTFGYPAGVKTIARPSRSSPEGVLYAIVESVAGVIIGIKQDRCQVFMPRRHSGKPKYDL